jgi:predicted 2-oxoglutarate/Fe(II)-dependent dioxygenase YbiX
VDENNEIIKQNRAILLDNTYADRSVSDILTINRKTFNKEIMDAMKSLHPAFHGVDTCNMDSTLLNYYGAGDHYKPHRDASQFTFLTFLVPEDKGYRGGDLVLEGIKIPQKDNMMIGFVGAYEHEVTPIQLKTDASLGRISMTQFLFTRGGA